MDPHLIDLSTRLAEVAVRSTATSIGAKIRAVKSSRDDKKIIAEMNDLIYELLEDKQELESIAKAYQEEFVAQKLSDKDLEFISNTVLPMLKQFLQEIARTQSDENEKQKTIKLIESLDAFKSLLSIQTLNVLQLIGFNFKQGIGEPLTDLLKATITGKNKTSQNKINELVTERDIEYFRMVQNEQAFERFMSLR
jgi:hypothetical protein